MGSHPKVCPIYSLLTTSKPRGPILTRGPPYVILLSNIRYSHCGSLVLLRQPLNNVLHNLCVFIFKNGTYPVVLPCSVILLIFSAVYIKKKKRYRPVGLMVHLCGRLDIAINNTHSSKTFCSFFYS